MSTTETTHQASCPDCPDGRAPRAAFEGADGWVGACPRHRTFWQIADEPPEDLPRIESVSGYTDLDAQAARERVIVSAGFRRVPVMSGAKFWTHPARPGTFPTDEAHEIAEGMNDG